MEIRQSTHIETLSENISIISLVDFLIDSAEKERASDIHMDPEGEMSLVRFRIDGEIHRRFCLSKKTHNEVVGRLKVLARLRSDLHHLPQDGRIRRENVKENRDIRLSIIPTHHGENAVLRILGAEARTHNLDETGMNETMRRTLRLTLSGNGLILVTGPTGSGKTTTLYSLLSEISPNKLVVTIEDPVEYGLGGIRQIQVNHRHGLTFSSILRSVLRQDPNVIMVGEIRDAETASLAIHAALTGHLVLSTLHTKNALSAIPRLIDLGIAPYLIASTLEVVVAERLIKRVGSGRVGLFEILKITPALAELINRGVSTDELKKRTVEEGFISMKEDAKEKIGLGIVSTEEFQSNYETM